MPPLSDQDIAILEFERTNTHWAFEGHRVSAIRARFDMSRDEYALVVVRLIRRPEALAHDPMTVRRLQRIVESRRR